MDRYQIVAKLGSGGTAGSGANGRPRTAGLRAFAPSGSVGIPPVAARGESAGPPARRFPRAPAPRDRPAPDASRSVSARSLKSVRTVILRGDSPLWKRQ